jgi:hypothetical protein
MKKLFLLLLAVPVLLPAIGYGQDQNLPYISDLNGVLQIRQGINYRHPQPFQFSITWTKVVKDPGNATDSFQLISRTLAKDSLRKSDTVVMDTIWWNAQVTMNPSDTSSVNAFNDIVNSIVGAAARLKNQGSGDSGSVTPNPPGRQMEPGPQKQPGGNRAFHSSILNGNYIGLMQYENDNTVPTDREAIQNDLLDILVITDGSSAYNRTMNIMRYAPAIQRIKNIGTIQNAQTLLKQTGGTPVTLQSVPTGSLLAGTAGINQQAIIEGIVDWIINSAKQELLESILEKWYDALYQDPIAGKLLTNTLKTYKQFVADNSVNLAKYGPLWKAAFQKDLANIPVDLEDETFVQTIIHRIAPAWAGERELTPVISGGTSIVYGMYQKKHIVTVLSELNSEYVTNATSWQDRLPVFKRAVIFSNIVASVVGQMKDNVYTPMSLDYLKNMDESAWSAFINMIYRMNKKELTLVLEKNPVDFINEIHNGPGAKFYNILSAAIAAYMSIQGTLSTQLINSAGVGAAPSKTISSDDFGKILDLSLAAVKKAVPYILDMAGQTNDPTFEYIVGDLDAIGNNISQIGQGITSQQYGMVLDGATQLLTYVDTILSIRYPNATRITASIAYITKFGSFMVSIISAQNPDDVSNALSELIPRDQYKQKNKSPWSVSLSAYPGFFYGTEKVTTYNIANGKPDQATPQQKWGSSASVYLPIGLDITKGFGNSCLGIFLQAFDLGAVLNYRLTNTDSTVSTNPNITWQQLLSPGASLFYQIPHTPIVFGGGFNYTPALRKIQQDGVSYDANALRWGIFLAVDVTAIHLSLFKGSSH